MPRRVIELLDCWKVLLGSRLVLAAWRMSHLCLMWSIRREQNAICFEDCEMSVEELKNILVKSFYIWMRTYNISHFSYFFEFVDFLFF
jgi:hypothetical protein